MDYNNMTEEEILNKVKSGEIQYSGDFFVNHNHNFNMTKALAVSGRLLGGLSVVNNVYKNIFGYDEIEISGGFGKDAYIFLGYACYELNKYKNLKVNIDFVEYLNSLGINSLKNKKRYWDLVCKSVEEITATGHKIKMGSKTYGRRIFIGYDFDESTDIISVYFCPSFVELQSKDKYILSSDVKVYKEIGKDTSISVLDVLRANNFKSNVNEISYADLKVAVISGAKKASHVKSNFSKAFDDLVSKGFAEFCYFEELPNKKVVVKFKLTKKGLMQDTSSVEKVKPAIAEPIAAPVIPKPVVIEQAPIDYSSMSLEEKLKALESTMVRLGVNPESLVQDPVSAVKTDWKSWEDENIDDADFIEADNDFSKSTPDNNSCNDELPF